MGESEAHLGSAPGGQRKHQTTQSIDLIAFFLLQNGTYPRLENLDRHTGVRQERAIGPLGQLGGTTRSCSSVNFADNAFDQIFDGDQPVDPSEFIDDQRICWCVLRISSNRSSTRIDGARIETGRTISGSEKSRPPRDGRENVLDVDDPDYIVERLAVDGQPLCGGKPETAATRHGRYPLRSP